MNLGRFTYIPNGKSAFPTEVPLWNPALGMHKNTGWVQLYR